MIVGLNIDIDIAPVSLEASNLLSAVIINCLNAGV